jgi:hypothetical protein
MAVRVYVDAVDGIWQEFPAATGYAVDADCCMTVLNGEQEAVASYRRWDAVIIGDEVAG